ncbi:TolC family protein [bacterium]|nr:TolC family protein [bacterium]
MQFQHQFQKIFCFLSFVLLSFPAFGLGEADTAILQALQQEEPELFERVKLVKEEDRELLEVTLSDILKMVIKRSMTIEADRMGEMAAMEGLAGAQGIYQSYLSASATSAKTASVSSSASSFSSDTASTNYLTSYSTDSTTLSTSLSKKNSLGISFSTTLQSTTSKTTTYEMADRGDSINESGSTDPYDGSSLKASVSVPIFQDWGDINDVSIRRSELSVDQSKVATQSTTNSLLESVAKTYWTMVGVQENIKTLQDAVALSKQLVAETKARVEVGVLNPTDLKEAETQLANNQKSLLTKKIQEQEIEDQIRVALNFGFIPYGFKPADLPRIHGEDFGFNSLLEKAYANSNTLKNLEISLKSNRYDLDEAYNSDKSNLDLNVSYTLSGWGSSTSESVEVFANQEYQGYSIGLTWSAPLFDRVTPKTIMKRKIERNKLELQIKDAQSQIHVSLQTILRNLKFGIREKETALLSVNLAKDLLEKEVEKLKIGKSTSYNVSKAQQTYTDAKLGETLVRVGNEQTFISLLVLTGDIFEYFGLPDTI